MREDLEVILNKLRVVKDNPSFYSDEEVDKILDVGERAVSVLQGDQDEDEDEVELSVDDVLRGLGRSPVVRKRSRFTDSIEVMMDIIEKESGGSGDSQG